MIEIPQNIQDHWATLVNSPLFWGGCVVFVLLILLWSFSRKKSSLISVSSGGLGGVSITFRALSDLIATACQDKGVLQKPQLKLTQKRSKLHFKIYLQSVPSEQISRFMAELQAYLAEVLEDNLGADHVGAIDLIIKGVTSRPKAKEEITLKIED